MNVIVQGIATTILMIAKYGPEIELLISAVEHHGVSRDDIRAVVRDLIVKKSDADMKAKYPNEPE